MSTFLSDQLLQDCGGEGGGPGAGLVVGVQVAEAVPDRFAGVGNRKIQRGVHPGRRAEQFEVAVGDRRGVEGAEDLDRLHSRRHIVGLGQCPVQPTPLSPRRKIARLLSSGSS